MARSLYVTALEPRSGKSVVALGLAELLAGRVERLGFLRPVVPAGAPDTQLELFGERYGASTKGVLSEAEAGELVAAGRFDEVEKRVVAAYRELAGRCDFVLCEGSDYGRATQGLDLDLNADLANQIGAPVLVVVRAGSAAEAEGAVNRARETLADKGCELLGVVVSRIPREAADEIAATDGLYVLPELPELAHPTVGQVAAAIGAQAVVDVPEGGQREVRAVRVAAMSVEHFVDDLVDGTLVIVPGDRPDIVVASLASALSPLFPSVAGIVLTGGYALSPTVRRLAESAPFPLLEVTERTYATATAVQRVEPQITAGDDRKVAAALGLFEQAVDTAELRRRIDVERPPRMTPIMFEYELLERAKGDRRRIVLPEGDDERVLRAAEILLRRGVVDLTILGDPRQVSAHATALGLDLSGAQLVDPVASPLREDFAARYHELRKHKGVTEELALDTMADVTYFGTMMVHAGEADGMVSGAAHTTGDTIRPAFEFIRAREGVSVVSSVFLMCLADRVLVYGDCAVNPSPNTEQLADIAISSAETAKTFGIEPLVAMLSYSTGESAKGAGVDMVRAATGLVRERRPDLKVEGPIQYDAAVSTSVAEKKLPESDVAGQATVFIFPDLDTGNIAYKAVQRSARTVAIGPVLQGLRKPVNDLSRGCKIPDIVNTVAITAIQAQDTS